MTQVNCAQLADAAAVLERTYELGGLPRLKDLLASPQGTVQAVFAFARLAAGRAGAKVTVNAIPILVCQRCLQDFRLPIRGSSDVEFARNDVDARTDSEREFYGSADDLISLRDLAEEELLLALPIAPACGTPSTCGRAPDFDAGDGSRESLNDMRRPFGILQDLLKKT